MAGGNRLSSGESHFKIVKDALFAFGSSFPPDPGPNCIRRLYFSKASLCNED